MAGEETPCSGEEFPCVQALDAHCATSAMCKLVVCKLVARVSSLATAIVCSDR